MIVQALEALTAPKPSDQQVLIRIVAEWMVRKYPHIRSGNTERSLAALVILAVNDLLAETEIKTVNLQAINRLANTIADAWTLLLQEKI